MDIADVCNDIYNRMLYKKQTADTFLSILLPIFFSLSVHLFPGLWPNNGLWRRSCVRPSILPMLGTNCVSCRDAFNPQDLSKVGQEAGGQLCGL